jgi:catechol 2,3-dioxygenase-like lactoylglutathione lyase family enzyme|tara:strand:- start:196 stop:675 length:480 start_codon:yes stop_codon:yes gene_type:complete
MTTVRLAVLFTLVVGLAGVPVPSAAQDTPSPGNMSFLGVGINVADIPRAEKFYTEVFGLVRTFQFPPDGTGDEIIEIGLGWPGQPGTLLLARLNDDPLPDGKSRYGRLVFNTDDAKGMATRATDAGSTILQEIDQSPNGPIIIFLDDPDGYQVELYQGP